MKSFATWRRDSALEREIDAPREMKLCPPADRDPDGLISRGKRVYRLYALTPDEIKLVEESAK